VLQLGTRQTVVGFPFTATITMSAEWRRARGFLPEDILRAGQAAAVVLVDGDRSLVTSCAKCGGSPSSKKRIATLGLSPNRSFGPQPDPECPGRETFTWDLCKVACTSSRLHFKSRLAIAVQLPGAPLCISESFEALSKPPAATGRRDRTAATRGISMRSAASPHMAHNTSPTMSMSPTPTPTDATTTTTTGTTTAATPMDSLQQIEVIEYPLAHLRTALGACVEHRRQAELFVTVRVMATTMSQEFFELLGQRIRGALRVDPSFVNYSWNYVPDTSSGGNNVALLTTVAIFCNRQAAIDSHRRLLGLMDTYTAQGLVTPTFASQIW
jgi:hypothetical protein